jgi:hypothetical protein
MRQTTSTALWTILGAMCVPPAFAEGPCPQGQRMVGQQAARGAVFPICQPIAAAPHICEVAYTACSFPVRVQ